MSRNFQCRKYVVFYNGKDYFFDTLSSAHAFQRLRGLKNAVRVKAYIQKGVKNNRPCGRLLLAF